MGFFTNGQKVVIESVYERTKKYLKPKDGKIHVVMINSFSKWSNQNFECEDNYSTQMDTIISAMQDEGYEILDIKFNSLVNQELSNLAEVFHTLITYK